MSYPNPTPPSTVVVDAGNAIHHVAHSMAYTGINYLPLVFAAGAALVIGLVFLVVAKLAR